MDLAAVAEVDLRAVEAMRDFSRGIHDGVDHDFGRLGFGESTQRRAVVLALAVEVVTEEAGLDGVCALGGVALEFGDLGDCGEFRLSGRLGHDARGDAYGLGIEEAARFECSVDTGVGPAGVFVIHQPPECVGFGEAGGFLRDVEQCGRRGVGRNKAERGDGGEAVFFGERGGVGAGGESALGADGREAPDQVGVAGGPLGGVATRSLRREGGVHGGFLAGAAGAPRFEVGAVFAIVAFGEGEEEVARRCEREVAESEGDVAAHG